MHEQHRRGWDLSTTSDLCWGVGAELRNQHGEDLQIRSLLTVIIRSFSRIFELINIWFRLSRSREWDQRWTALQTCLIETDEESKPLLSSYSSSVRKWNRTFSSSFPSRALVELVHLNASSKNWMECRSWSSIHSPCVAGGVFWKAADNSGEWKAANSSLYVWCGLRRRSSAFVLCVWVQS